MDELVVFASNRDDSTRVLDELVTFLGRVGLKKKHAENKKKLTTQTQAGRPDNLQARPGRT